MAKFYNPNTGTNSDGILIQVGATAPGNSNNYISFLKGNAGKIGEIEGHSGGVRLVSSSDRRLKTKIRTLENGLELIANMRPTVYERKAIPGVDEVGFIAQELQRAFPQVVSGDSTIAIEEEIMKVNYSGITPVLTAGIKELHELVKQQQAVIGRSARAYRTTRSQGRDL